MGRPRRTDRHDETDAEQPRSDARESSREPERDQYENPMFADAAESPLHIPESEWREGYAWRWIRVEAANMADNTNWAKMSRIGWSPVPRDLVAARFPSTPMPGTTATSTEQVVIFGGLCLCERPSHLVERDKKRQEQATQDAGRTIESYVEGGNANFPRFNQSQPVQIEHGRAQFKE